METEEEARQVLEALHKMGLCATGGEHSLERLEPFFDELAGWWYIQVFDHNGERAFVIEQVSHSSSPETL